MPPNIHSGSSIDKAATCILVAPGRAAGPGLRLAPDHAVERANERANERASERANERANERVIERANERAIERGLDRTLARTAERAVDQNLGREVVKPTTAYMSTQAPTPSPTQAPTEASIQAPTQARPQGQRTAAAQQHNMGERLRSAMVTAIEEAAEATYWRDHYRSRPYAGPGANHNDFGPAYAFALLVYRDHAGAAFDSLAPALALAWPKHCGRSSLDWARACPAVRDAWERLHAR